MTMMLARHIPSFVDTSPGNIVHPGFMFHDSILTEAEFAFGRYPLVTNGQASVGKHPPPLQTGVSGLAGAGIGLSTQLPFRAPGRML